MASDSSKFYIPYGSAGYDQRAVDPITKAVTVAGTLAAPYRSGDWVNAVEQNATGHTRFVEGPWKATYGLGTYGIDPHTRTAWAVVDHDRTFAVDRHIHRHSSGR